MAPQYIDKSAVVGELERLYELEYANTSNLSCGKKVMLRHILHFLDTIEVKELPTWKKSTLPHNNVTGFNSDYFTHDGYYINYKELFEVLPKENNL